MPGQSLFSILDHLASHRRKLVLMQGRRYWRVEDLFAQAKLDVKSDEHRGAVLAPDYTWREQGGKIGIFRGDKPVFAEPGSDLAT